MERCSYFIRDKALFGSFPSQETVRILENNGVRIFVDLTGFHERGTEPYVTSYKYIKYPIIDSYIPNDWKSFSQLIIQICYEIKNLEENNKIYIHCKGGHGRSGIVVASILCYYYNIPVSEALKITSKCHAKRPEMRLKWRKLGSPQNKKQKDFVYKFFSPLKYGKPDSHIMTYGFNNDTPYNVTIDNKEYKNAQEAYQYKRNSNIPSFEENKIEYMSVILENKFRQNSELKENLMNTYLRPLIKVSPDSFWGDGNNNGKNIHGKLLSTIRSKFLIEDMYNLTDVYCSDSSESVE